MDKDTYIKSVANESLSVFGAIADKAKNELSKYQNGASGNTALAYVNVATGSAKAINNIDSISDNNKKGLNILLQNPAYARVVVSDEKEQQHIFYISRGQSVHIDYKGVKLISYKNEMGRLAALSIGDEEEIEFQEKKQYFEVLEVSHYTPLQEEKFWNSKPTVFRYKYGTYTVKSLLAVLKKASEGLDEFIDGILDGSSDESNILEGLQREVRTSAVLRDQPILDKFQDEIFRLPINKQLLIIGPPGTGKTTTLIQRLGQKLTEDALSSFEKTLVMENGIKEHQNSWLMFTPTDLLKHFVKEAFNREEQVTVSATDDRIKTWSAYRSDIARRVLGISQTVGSKGKFILKDNISYTDSEIQSNPITWYENFKTYHSERIISQLHQGIKLLETSLDTNNDDLIKQLKFIINKANTDKITSLFSSLYQLENDLDLQIKKLKSESDKEIKKSLVFLINKEGKEFIGNLVTFLNTIKSSSEGDDDDKFDNDVEELEESTSVTQKQAITTYMRILRSLARYEYQNKQPPKNSITAKFSIWLGNRLPSKDILIEIGRSITTQNGFRRFQKTFNRYVNDVPSSYKLFRKNALKNKTGEYSSNPENNKYIDSTEMDAIILLMLRNTRELLAQRFVINNLDKSIFDNLNIISQQFKNQILVDEATDFSVLQLAAMESLTSLKTRSFFACGDFNQRISSWGVRSQSQIEWISEQIKIQSINVVYRQSQKLNQFAGMLLKQFNGDLNSQGELPTDMKNPGLYPVLLEDSMDLDNVSIWLLERLKEVETIAGIDYMPTVAVLVNTKDEVEPMAKALNKVVEEIGLRAEACIDGKSLGEATNIRIYDVKHIKGLEFEAVFFIDIDVLEEKIPELFGKYLYVGATRAATHFGVTCKDRLPSSLEPLREQFVDTWGIA